MNSITENPFRILGLDASCSNKQIIKNINKYETYSTIGKKVEFPFDDGFFGNVERTNESINKSKNAIHIDDRKVKNGFFWFVIDSAFDQIAIQKLQEKDYEKAISIWKKQINNNLSNETVSAFNNLSTIYLLLGTVDKVNTVMLKEGLMLKCTILESSSLEHLCKKICGDEYLLKRNEFSHEIIQMIQNDLKDNITESQLIKVTSNLPPSIKEAFANELVSSPIQTINQIIEETKEVTEKNRQAEKHGKDLILKTKEPLSRIKNILGETDYNYGACADKIANQILQNGIIFWNATFDDYSYLSSYKYAQQIAVSSELKTSIKSAINHCISKKEEKKCWFCEINEVITGKELRVQMHKYTDVYSRKYTYFRDGGLAVGRCSDCKDSHTSLLGDNFLSRTIFGIKKVSGKTDIKGTSNSTLRNHPIIKEKINEGYQFGLPQ